MKDNAWTATAGGALSYTITGLTGGTSYDVQVRAVRGTTDGSWSETAVGDAGRSRRGGAGHHYCAGGGAGGYGGVERACIAAGHRHRLRPAPHPQ